MKIKYIIFIVSVVLFSVITQEYCIAEVDAILYEYKIHRRSLGENVFDSLYKFNAKGFIIINDKNNNILNQSSELKINKITVSFNNMILTNCDFFIVNKSNLEVLFANNNDIPEMLWNASCSIPREIPSGQYTATINLNMNSLNKIISKNDIIYNKNSILLIICYLLAVASIEFIIIYIFRYKNILKNILLLSVCLLSLVSYFTKNIYIFYGVIFYLSVIIILYCLYSSLIIHNVQIKNIKLHHRLYILIFIIITIYICIAPMPLSPNYNLKFIHQGKFVNKIEQYSALAQSIIKGNLYIDYGELDEKLVNMKNPYNPEDRIKDNVSFAWDHAFYNNRYYMYFGVLPVFIIFIPYQLMTGNPLNSVYATQIFVSFFIIGMYSLFYLLSKSIFNEIKLSLFLALSSIFSIISIWYSIDAPALYCTAITAGLCFQIWSMYFFIKSLLITGENKIKFIYIVIGSFFGSFVLGCRPTIFLANILLIPVVFDYIKYNKLKNLSIYIYIVLPYIVIGILIMLYNYIRFDNPFEFGLSYMLTDCDLHDPGYFKSRLNYDNIITGINLYFFEFNGFSNNFPYIKFNGIFFNFPILLLSILILSPRILSLCKRYNILWFVISLIFILFIITSFNSIAVPIIRERYRMDLYYILGIISFISICSFYMYSNKSTRDCINISFNCLSFITFIYTILLFLIPYDGNVTHVYKEINIIIRNILTLGLNNI